MTIIMIIMLNICVDIMANEHIMALSVLLTTKRYMNMGHMGWAYIFIIVAKRDVYFQTKVIRFGAYQYTIGAYVVCSKQVAKSTHIQHHC